MRPLVSVIAPCYEQGHFLPEALDSVLAQSFGDFEAIVVDDGSSDSTRNVVRRYSVRDPRVRCIHQSNQGLARARNAGLAEARGAYLVFLDADDRLLPDALSAGVRSLEQNPAAVYTRGRFEVIDAGGRLLPSQVDDTVGEEDEYESLLRHNPIWVPASVMYRRAVFDSTLAFDPRVDAAADLEMYLRLARLYQVACHSSIVAQYRRHPRSMSMNPSIMAPAVHAVLAAQREYVEENVRWRAALRQAMRNWERQHLIPMMRRALHSLGAGDPRPMLASFPLIAASGPGALARRCLRRAKPGQNGSRPGDTKPLEAS